MLALALTLSLLGQYPVPEDQPTCATDPAVKMVFRAAVECPSHTLRFEWRDDGTFRVVCTPERKALPKRKRAAGVAEDLSYRGG